MIKGERFGRTTASSGRGCSGGRELDLDGTGGGAGDTRVVTELKSMPLILGLIGKRPVVLRLAGRGGSTLLSLGLISTLKRRPVKSILT